MFIEIRDYSGYRRFINTIHITNIKPFIVVNVGNNSLSYQNLDGYIICLTDNTQIKISIEQYKSLVLELGE